MLRPLPSFSFAPALLAGALLLTAGSVAAQGGPGGGSGGPGPGPINPTLPFVYAAAPAFN